jgi:NitT/TauT family transport system permease protein
MNPHTWPRRMVRSEAPAVQIAALLAFFAVWEAAVIGFGIRRYLLPRPSSIMAFVVEHFPMLLLHTRVTASEALAGLGLAVIVGVFLATAMVYSAAVRAILLPAIATFNSVPKIALAPLILVWFGLGFASKVVTAFLVCVFPIIVNSTTGMREIDPDLVRLVRLMRATKGQELRKIRFPNALPSIFAGLKIAVPLSIIGALVAEFISARRGLGFLIISANAQVNTELAFAAIIMIAAFSMILYTTIGMLERRILHWRLSERQ